MAVVLRRASPLALMAMTLALSWRAQAASSTISLHVDASEAPRKILHARLSIPVQPGPVDLCYPKWIPGEHGPTGPVAQLAGLTVSVGGKPVAWQRAADDLYRFHVHVPAGAGALDVAFDFLDPIAGHGFAGSADLSPQLGVIEWNRVLLYPQGVQVADLAVKAYLVLPEGWQAASALPVAHQARRELEFQAVPLDTLVDSPVLVGAHLRRFEIAASDRTPHWLDVAADGEASLDVRSDLIEAMRKLVDQARLLLGPRPYPSYHFLLALSDRLSHHGLEHLQSSDNRVPERMFSEEAIRTVKVTLLPHELAHAWNGVGRRPVGLMAPDFQQARTSELLWVYEGLTTYVGNLLTARSGLRSEVQAREDMAYSAAGLDISPGRSWRPLLDTAVAAHLGYGAPGEWRSWRRGQDFYSEAALIWLEADTLIRERSGGKRSLDDFCRAFFGGDRQRPAYSLDHLLAALNAVEPYNWRGFFAERLQQVSKHAPLAGLERAGWKLDYVTTPSTWIDATEKANRSIDLTFSLGLLLGEDGTIRDCLPGSAAARAGLSPGMKVIGVNGRRFSPALVREAVRDAKPGHRPSFIIENGDFISTLQVDYTRGHRYPLLVRLNDRPDLLAAMLAPRAP